MATLTASASWPVAEARPAKAAADLGGFAAASMGLLLAFPPPAAGLACALFLGLALIGGSLRRLPDRAFVFLAAIVLSLIPALMVTPGPRAAVGSGFAALLVAFGFFVAGLAIGRALSLIRDLLMGLSVAAVTHVLLAGLHIPASHTWAFCAAGLLLAFGPTLETPLQRGFAVTAGLAAAALAFLGTGTVGAAAIATWAVLFGLSAWRAASRITYHAFLGAVALGAIVLAVAWPRLGPTPLAQDFVSAFERFTDGSLVPSLAAAAQALPFGLGAGHGRPDIAGVATELGLLGLAGFAMLVAFPLRAGRRANAPRLLMTFIPAAVVLMVGTALYADPLFLLMLGVASVRFRSGSVEGFPSELRRNVQLG
jgi:hypothetical protein